MYTERIIWRCCATLSIMSVLSACGISEPDIAVQPTKAIPTAIPATSPHEPGKSPTAATEPTSAVTEEVLPTVPSPLTPAPTSWTVEFHKHRTLWEQSNIAEYWYTQEIHCACMTNVTAPFHVIVLRNDSVSGFGPPATPITLDALGKQRPRTIEEIFQVIEDAINLPVVDLQVDYDPTLGYPIRLHIDPRRNGTHDEITFDISGFLMVARATPTLPPQDPPDTSSWASVLDKHRTLWEHNKVTAYSYTQKIHCACSPENIQPVDIIVQDNSVSGIGTVNPIVVGTREIKRPYTIDEIFQVIEDAIKLPVGDLQVDYDPILGYPSRLRIDSKLEVADDEITFEITQFDVIQMNWPTSVPPQTPDPVSWGTELDKHRTLWENSKITAYRYIQEQSCLCGPASSQPFAITVQHDTVTGIGTQLSYSLESFNRNRPRTIEDFFTLIEDAIKLPTEALYVTYDPTLGYPTMVHIDYNVEGSDEEDAFIISQFEVIEKGQ